MNTGIDCDLKWCLDYNPQDFTVDDIETVLAVWEGQNDGDDWRWIIRHKDGRYIYQRGGCDYTGWDCQSWATSVYAETPEAAAMKELEDTMANVQAVYADLLRQFNEGKRRTWCEEMDDEFGLGG